MDSYSSIWETEKNGIVYAVFRLNGKNKWERIGERKYLDRKAINAKKSNIVRKLAKGEYITKKVLFEKMAEEFLEFASKYRTPRTYHTNIGHCKSLLKYFRGRMLSQITPYLIEGYIDERRKQNPKLSNKTIINELFTLSALFRQAIKRGYVKENPVKTMERLSYIRPEGKAFTKREVDLILANCSRYLRGILLVGLTCGFRRSEICNLKWENIDFAEEMITIKCDETFQTKNKKPRMAVIVPKLRGELEFLKKNWVDPRTDAITPRQAVQMKYLFCHYDGSPIKDFSSAFSKLMEKLEVEGTPHTMRNTFITFHESFGDPFLTQKMVRHSSLKVTEGYYVAQLERMKTSMKPIMELVSSSN